MTNIIDKIFPKPQDLFGGLTVKELDQAMKEHECWEVQEHFKNCKKCGAKEIEEVNKELQIIDDKHKEQQEEVLLECRKCGYIGHGELCRFCARH